MQDFTWISRKNF